MASTTPFKVPPFDPKLEAARTMGPLSTDMNSEILTKMRSLPLPGGGAEAFDQDPEITHTELTIPGPEGDSHEIKLSILELKSQKLDGETETAKLRPAIYHIHGGGLCLGDRFLVPASTQIWVKTLNAVFISVEYRLAPEHPYPAPLEDCYAGLQYVAQNAVKLRIDVNSIMVVGASAGGGLAAGTALLARDRGFGAGGSGKLKALCLFSPMIDDRMESLSSRQLYEAATWNGKHNTQAWEWYLANEKKRGDGEVSIYAAPARANDLSGLPDTWLDVGEVDLFRDEGVSFASRIWQAGGNCELHVWRGAWHGFELLPTSFEVVDANENARLNWIRRVMV